MLYDVFKCKRTSQKENVKSVLLELLFQIDNSAFLVLV